MNYQFEENILYICTDGASRSVFNEKLKRKTGRYGGKGIRFIYYNENFELIEEDHSDYISYIQSTNQDMELCAVITGLKKANNKDLNNFKNIIIITDSDTIYKNRKCAFYGYRNKPGVSWKTKYGDPVIHKKERKELVKIMQEIYRKFKINIDFDLVKGHQKDSPDDERIKYNIKADKSAVKGAQSKIKLQLNNTILRSPFFNDNKRYKEGFLDIGGMEILIHICNSRYIRKNWFRYNYEVVSHDSKYFMQVGRLFYDKNILSAKNIYLVKIKNDGSNQIESIISTHTKDEIKQRMLTFGYDESIFYSGKKLKK